MSLKDLISSLIEAVFGSKKAFISNQAMPNVASHITLANNVGNETEFVAPSNGYVCLQGQSNAVNNELYLVSNELRSSSWGVNGWGVRVFLPIGKGQSFKASSNGLAFNALTFISSIGGGINRLLSQAVRDVLGGGLCLSYLATFERSLRCLARKLCQRHLVHNLLSYNQIHSGMILSPRLTDILLSELAVIPVHFVRLNSRTNHAIFMQRLFLSRKLKDTQAGLLFLKKGMFSVILSQIFKVTQEFTRISFQQPARLSFCQGGAL